MSEVALALIQYDPDGALFDQTVRVLPRLQQVFAGITVCANAATDPRSIDILQQSGVRVTAEAPQVGLNHIGWFRRTAVQLSAARPWRVHPLLRFRSHPPLDGVSSAGIDRGGAAPDPL